MSDIFVAAKILILEYFSIPRFKMFTRLDFEHSE